MSKIVAIHQPNFFPWLGYFNKIVHSDIFVFFDDVQLSKSGGTWSNRVKFLINGEAKWVTAPINRNYHGTSRINEIEFKLDEPWREKVLKNIEINYCSHPYFNEVFEFFAPLLSNPETNIAEYNIHSVTAIVQRLGFDVPKLRRSSDLNHEGSSNDLLCSVTRLVGGTTYMCGGGADGYQDEAVFVKHGIKLKHQNFIHPQYYQFKCTKFISGLSIIDAAMNLGWDNLAQQLKSSTNL
jgi:hypothetical protein